jgi:hypothetical protein
MFRRVSAVVLALMLAIPMVDLRAVSASPLSGREGRMTQKVKDGIAKLGVGPEARVQLKLKDKTKLAGYISAVEPEHFVVTDLTTGQQTTVPYPDVAQVKGNNLTTRTKIIIAASIIAGVIIVLYIVRGAFCDGC